MSLVKVYFVKLEEQNIAAGEVWNFYVPTADNRKVIDYLRDIVNFKGSSFHVSEETLDEETVDSLCEHSDVRTRPEHTKLFGKLRLPPRVTIDVLTDAGICDLMYTNQEGKD